MSDDIDAINRRAMAKLRRDKLIGWQPIETAPKDGTSILVCDARIVDWVQVVAWDDKGPAPYKWALSDGPNYHVERFTHWQPLPAPPELS